MKVRDLRLTSIENLRQRVCAENDPGLKRLFSKLYFVGFLSTRQALFQHCEAETSCYRFFTAPVLREFFYQVGSYSPPPSIPMNSLTVAVGSLLAGHLLLRCVSSLEGWLRLAS